MQKFTVDGKSTINSKTSAMKSKSTFSILSLAIVFASCTTAYKLGQTPDDVYYSPARPQEYARQEKQDDQRYSYDEEAYRDDRYLRMKIHDRRYTTLYDDYYSYNPYYYHYYNGNLMYNTPWSSYNYWNYYYNPYCSHVISVVPKTPTYNRPRTFDLGVYTPQNGNAKSYNTSKGGRYSNTYSSPNSTNSNNYRNSGRDAGTYLRDIFSGSGNSNSSSNSSPTSTSRSSSSSGSSSSGSSSSGSSSGSRGNASRGNN
jgi:hypothetical protein